MDSIFTAIAIITALPLLSAVHASGHLVAARLLGLPVTTVAFGIGPAIWKHRPAGGATTYHLNVFPIGCHITAEHFNPFHEDLEGAQSKTAQYYAPRIVTVLAGPFANCLFATLLIFGVLVLAGVERPRIGEVIPDAPAAAAGMRAGDVVLRVGGAVPADFGELSAVINAARGDHVEVVVRRNGSERFLLVAPREDPRDHRFRIGIRAAPVPAYERIPIARSARFALLEPSRITADVIEGFVRATRRSEKVEMLGPIGIGREAVRASRRHSWRVAVGLIAHVSVSFALVALLPLPGFDGAQFGMLLSRMVLRRRYAHVVEGLIYVLGLAMVVWLYVWRGTDGAWR